MRGVITYEEIVTGIDPSDWEYAHEMWSQHFTNNPHLHKFESTFTPEFVNKFKKGRFIDTKPKEQVVSQKTTTKVKSKSKSKSGSKFGKVINKMVYVSDFFDDIKNLFTNSHDESWLTRIIDFIDDRKRS